LIEIPNNKNRFSSSDEYIMYVKGFNLIELNELFKNELYVDISLEEKQKSWTSFDDKIINSLQVIGKDGEGVQLYEIATNIYFWLDYKDLLVTLLANNSVSFKQMLLNSESLTPVSARN